MQISRDAIRRPAQQPVALLLLTLLSLALVALPFLNFAPNRLVAGEPLMGWQINRFGLLLLPLVTLWLLLWRPPGRATLIVALLMAELMLAAIIWLSGHQATLLSQQGSRLARTSFASGLWCSGALILLLITDQVRQLTPNRLAQLLLNLQVWLLPLLLLFSGQLADLSLLKEYANRHAVFDAALSRHLTLLAGTVLPALMIALPLGVMLFRRPGWQGSVFGVLNVIQTVPSVALFGLLIAPLAGLAQHFPWLGDWGISGIGMAPALIALVLYALLPLVRSVVVGLQQVPHEVRESARGTGMSGWQQFIAVDVPLALPVWLAGLRVVVVQTLGMAVVAALIGAGGFGAIIFQGLLSSALDLVLLGVIPVIALAVVIDALFRLLISLLERKDD
ncbi:ABC transporter permease [Pantoea sp. Bo_2]|uniref:ABC transporter permease n=1 Tax=Candidatus Pantoea gossypiicola TaxID=2608008 RepID=A0AB34CJ22_9GAMM|nr:MULTISPECIES: ABC transporter permease [Pantoea]KAA5932141.1 ABC transporter permease [Pantoea sp. VH_8]KAA5937202.1 ABC transporter permease [Pantoea sp. VH_4]KAA5946894.1 ABC transporter permease [Pantoea sp. VH_3]KAA5952293.1 ABC transporter permease [Pantoea sp. VH_25]KAA5954461.1 ABC transporter permease [Pantoea sp. VH_24]